MTKAFSPLKALKVGLTSLALAGSCLVASTASAYIHTQDGKIVDDSNRPIFFNGANLGNWLVWEGYMLMNDLQYRTHTQFFWGLETAFGTANAITFEQKWRENYVTQKTIQELSDLGYNSVRVPFNWKLLWNDSTKSLKPEGYVYIDNLITWCKPLGIKILLDMHGLPGYQNPGDHSDNLDSKAPTKDYQYTVKFLDKNANGIYNYEIAGDAWRAIATRYASESTIWGYDIMNEPNTEGRSAELLSAQKRIIAKIREVDSNHVVVVEGDGWAGWMDMYNMASTGWNGTLLDPKSNVVLETHHYLPHRDYKDPNYASLKQADANTALYELDKRVKIANAINLPIILGEFGEEDGWILRKLADAAQSSTGYDGSFAWTFKKMSSDLDRSLWVVNPMQGRSAPENAFLELRSAIAENRKFYGNWTDLMTFLQSNLRNGHPNLEWRQAFYDNTKNSLLATTNCTRSAFKALSFPGSVEAEDFDNGCSNSVYLDSTTGNAGGTSYRNSDVDIGTTGDNSGLYVGWTALGEWLEYTVNVAQAGDYTFNFRYASAYPGANIRVNAGSNSVVTDLNVTGGWDIWNNATSGKIYLPAGQQIIRLTFNGGSNLNNFNVSAVAPSLPPVPAAWIQPGTYNLIANASPVTNGSIGRGLDADLGAADGAVQLYDISSWGGGTNQRWSIQQLPNEGNTYKVVNVNTGKVLTVALAVNSVNNGTLLTQSVWESKVSQKWKFVANGNGTFSIISAAPTGGSNWQAVDVRDGNFNNQQKLQVWSFTPGNTNQQWKLILR